MVLFRILMCWGVELNRVDRGLGNLALTAVKVGSSLGERERDLRTDTGGKSPAWDCGKGSLV